MGLRATWRALLPLNLPAGARACHSPCVLCLKRESDPRWADLALDALPVLLADHAHCEMKAASNALSLATRWPAVAPASASLPVARALIELAEEELTHFRAVLVELERRRIPLGKPEVDAYASSLRDALPVAKTARGKIVDRLLVAALIEARSCERFALLADALARRGDALEAFYRELFTAEARHYATLVDLAELAAEGATNVRERLGALAVAEGEIVAGLGLRPTMHG